MAHIEYAEVDKAMHKGDFVVRSRSLLIRGVVSGDLHVQGDSDVELKGIVRGSVHLHQGRMYLRGVAEKDVVNHGGTLTVRGSINGTLHTHGGETVVLREALVKHVAQPD